MSIATPEAHSKASSCAGLCAFRGMMSNAQDSGASWSDTSAGARLRVLRRARHAMASQVEAFAAAVSPELTRSKADTIVTELLPLLDACKFLERNASSLLAPRKLGRSGRPLWLGGVHAEIHREPLGHVLVIGPANFPLFLPGAQVLQALAAGNTVTWKPGGGGIGVAQLVSKALRDAGLPDGALRITDDTVEAAQMELAKHPDKVIFTGSSASGHHMLTRACRHRNACRRRALGRGRGDCVARRKS